jgi:hypothetical protein
MEPESRKNLQEAREELRDLLRLMPAYGMNPREGFLWGSSIELYDRLLHELASESALPEVPSTPWTMAQRLGIDEICRTRGLVVGAPLLDALPE